jgi:hypothetical protein
VYCNPKIQLYCNSIIGTSSMSCSDVTDVYGKLSNPLKSQYSNEELQINLADFIISCLGAQHFINFSASVNC